LRKLTQILVFAALLLLAALVFVCVVSPSPNMKDLGWMPRNLANWADLNPTFRNFPVFAALSLVASIALGSRPDFKPVRSAFSAALAVSLFGTAVELLQIWIPGRFFDPNDIAWSVSGAFAGSVLALPLLWLLARQRHGG
jgi:VanZ family protein